MHGILNIAKPQWMSSRDVVNRVARLAGKSKTGHAGTLDPLATGVLVCPVGQGTRLIEYIQRMPKTYEGTFLLGKSSDTEDVTGKVTELPEPPQIDRSELESILPQFLGTIQQVPPSFSALKVQGKRAYKLARAGTAVTLAARPVEIYALELLEFDFPRFRLRIECGSGTYVRSLGRDIARRLGTEAVMESLVRTAIGPYHLDQAAVLEDLDEAALAEQLLPLVTAVQDLPQATISPEDARLLVYGQQVSLPGVQPAEELASLDAQGNLLAILVPTEQNTWRSAKNFQAAIQGHG